MPDDTAEVPTTHSEDMQVDRIGYVDTEGRLFTIAPDGTDQQPLVGEALVRMDVGGSPLASSLRVESFFTWPTWSPDGSKIAASQVQVVNDQIESSIQIIDVADGRMARVYSNEDTRVYVADNAPHYLYWSPDSRLLGFLIATEQGLTLLVEDTHNPSVPVEVESDARLYFHWAPDGEAMVVHAGQAIQLVRRPFDTGASQHIARSRGFFFVPALSPDGTLMAYTKGEVGEGEQETAYQLLVGKTGAAHEARRLLQVGRFSAFRWSPDGSELAVADTQTLDPGFFDRLRVVSADGATLRNIAEEEIIAFYWAPAGDKIAWVGRADDERSLEWSVASRAGDSVQRLFRFQPSPDVVVMLRFFDQYAYSHSPWSPDSTRLVVAGTQDAASSGRNGQSPTGNRVFVLDASGAAPPQEIATGNLAFWSWN